MIKKSLSKLVRLPRFVFYQTKELDLTNERTLSWVPLLKIHYTEQAKGLRITKVILLNKNDYLKKSSFINILRLFSQKCTFK